MAARYLLLIFPALVSGNIQINLSGIIDGQIQARFSGSEISIISDAERSTFLLTEENLKTGALGYFGKIPNDVYLRSPTPWGDLYKTQGWSEVSRALVPKSAKVLTVSSEPVIVLEQYFENNSTKAALFNVALSNKVDNTFSSSWSRIGEMTVGQEVSFEIDVEVAEGGASTSMTFSSAFGRNVEKTQTITVGTSSGMELSLEPNQAVISQLQVQRGSVRVEVEYEASLFGAVIANYDDVYKGHHFWALDINQVMQNANLEKTRTYKEVVEVSFYWNSRIIVSDANTNVNVFSVNV